MNISATGRDAHDIFFESKFHSTGSRICEFKEINVNENNINNILPSFILIICSAKKLKINRLINIINVFSH